jgi:hypothetical protein
MQDPLWQMDDRMAMMEAEIALLRRQNELSQLRRALGALTDDGGLPRVLSIGLLGAKRALAAQIRTPDGDSGLFGVGDIVGNWKIHSIEAQQVMVEAANAAGRGAARLTKLPMESMGAALERQRNARAAAAPSAPGAAAPAGTAATGADTAPGRPDRGTAPEGSGATPPASAPAPSGAVRGVEAPPQPLVGSPPGMPTVGMQLPPVQSPAPPSGGQPL